MFQPSCSTIGDQLRTKSGCAGALVRRPYCKPFPERARPPCGRINGQKRCSQAALAQWETPYRSLKHTYVVANDDSPVLNKSGPFERRWWR